MENGSNDDQNFYSRRPLPHSPDRQHRYPQQPDRTTLDHFDSTALRGTSPPAELLPRLSFLTTSNLQAVTSNGFAPGLSADPDPDDFYREYRAPNGYPDPARDDMATKASNPRRPTIPVARTGLKPSLRSVSEPVTERSVLGNTRAPPALNGIPQGQNRVKDLLKRFDQNIEASSSIPRKPTSRLLATDPINGLPRTRDRAGSQSRAVSTSQANNSSGSSATTHPETAKPLATSRFNQRARFESEEHDANNALPSETRTATRPQNVGPRASTHASKSMTNLSPTSPDFSPRSPVRKPLFGEILPTQGIPEVGYGIQQTARRTSDPDLRPATSLEDSSSVDISPSSPTAWYLGFTPDLQDVDHRKAQDAFQPHSRNRSGSAGISGNNKTNADPAPISTVLPNAQVHEVSKPSSRLPVSTKRLSNQSGSSSPSSPVLSPNRSHVSVRRKAPDQSAWAAPTGRAVTPTGRTTTTSSTVTPPPRNSSYQSPRRGKVPERLNTNPSSLKAYITTPPPKESPPLRSSRPRLPVSSATTTPPPQKTTSQRSPRRSTDASGSPQYLRGGTRATRSHSTNRSSPPRIDSGPVDFIARRERIQRAYTKSIQETEQREIRAANLRRLNERHAQILAEKQAEEKDAVPPEAPIAESVPKTVPEPAPEPAPAPIPQSVPEPLPSPAKPLQITTSFFLPEGIPGEQDSPTLGMPGRFLDDEEPASAVTATTEFDNEQQTEAPQLSRVAENRMSSTPIEWNDLSVEQATFGIRHSLSLTSKLDNAFAYDSSADEQQPEHTPTNDVFLQDLSRPGAFSHDSVGYGQPVFASTITTPSPKNTPPRKSRSASPLKFSHINSDAGDSLQQSATSQIYPPPQILLHQESEATEPIIHSNLPQLGMDEVLNYLRAPDTEVNFESSDSYSGRHATESDSYEATYEQTQDIRASTRNRLSSQRSSWTNDSIGTAESSRRGEYVSSPSVPATIEPDQNTLDHPWPASHSPHASQQLSTESPDPSRENHTDPAISTQGGFGIAFSDSPPVALWPPYAPPPPPDPQLLDHAFSVPPARSPPPNIHNKRPASGLFQFNHNDTGRTAESPRASEDVGSARVSVYTPRSSTQISLEGSTANQSFDSRDVLIEPTEEDKKAAEKLKKRLFQRRMLIKELIDTESVYLKDMNVVEEIYKGTAEACPNLDSNDIKAIFRNSDEIVSFSTMFLDELKSAATSVYSPRAQRKSKAATGGSTTSPPSPEDRFSVAATLTDEGDDQKDRRTFIGANFGKHLKQMQAIYTDFLKNSEHANSRLSALQADSAVKVWLSECNLVAKDLTAAWDLDALLIKPVQRITRYQLLLAQIFEHTSDDHPDWPALRVTVDELAMLLKNIDDLKKRIQMVGKIVGRKRKESDVRTGIAKAFARRADKLQLQAPSTSRPRDDDIYLKLTEKFGDDFLRLQVVLRDVEYYTREITTYVRKFLEHLSSIELMMRIGASAYPELESKWVRFNISMRDMGSSVLEQHIAAVRMKVIEPFENVIQLYAPPSLAMKKRNKRRLDYEKFLTIRGQGKKVDEKLAELVDQYEALNETLKIELPKLSSCTINLGIICLAQFLHIQTDWFGIWQEKVRAVLEDNQVPNEIADIVTSFHRDFQFAEARIQELGIINGTFLTGGTTKPRTSQSTSTTYVHDPKGRTSNLSSRSRGLSFNGERSPGLPTPEFEKTRHSGNFTGSNASQLGYQPTSHSNHSRSGSLTPGTPDPTFGSRPHAMSLARPNTGRSDSGTPRPSNEFSSQNRRESGSTTASGYRHIDGPPQTMRPFSGLFHSAMPLPDGPEDSQRSSRASSRDRNVSGGYNILYLAASLFEFNISATKSEAGYPYLTYQAGEIFDVIGEKGELWLAKNQDDVSNEVGWIWSKHFARLAAD